jgi:Rrf2 family protein
VKLSNKGRYGVKAIFDIAFHNHGKATQIKEIAERQAIPPRFLEQIFQDLKKAGLVSSKRGPRGGYQLAVSHAEIRIGDIVRALEGPVVLGRSSRGDDHPEGDATSRAVTDEAFDDLATQIEACLDGRTIEDLCERGESLGYRRRPPSKYVYVI